MRKQMIALAALCPLTVFAVSPVHNKVIDYVPAPGQFVNVLPEWEDGDDSEAMAAKALQYMTEEGYYISLGAWGGYVTVGFERTIVNVPGKRDIYIEGNAFQSSQSSTKGGNSEPGVVMVAYDINHNGIPDGNEWFEIAGSEYSKSIHNYEVSYIRPASDNDDIMWMDNQGNSGFVNRIPFHTQPYWPQWLSGRSKLTFQGCRLPDNSVNEGTADDPYIVLKAFDYGYADNYPNFSDKDGLVRNEDAMIDIDWAVDANGNAVKLPGVDFVRIYTGVNQTNGILGENSTEVVRVVNTHSVGTGDAESVDESIVIDEKVLAEFLARYGGVESLDNSGLRLYVDQSGLVSFSLYEEALAQVFDLKGRCLFSELMPEGRGFVDLSSYSNGIYLVSVAGQTVKVMKR